MLLEIRHALLEITNYPNTKQSAIILNNELVITSGSILQPYLQPISRSTVAEKNTASAENICASTKIIHKLQQYQLINAQEKSSAEGKYLSSLNFQVTFDRRKPPIANRRQPHILTRYHASILYLFSSPEILRNLHKFLNSSEVSDEEVLPSSFLVLSLRHTKQKETFDRFLMHIGHYLRYLHSIHTLDDVLTMCTPFGLENFYKTISIGKISNVMGSNGCLFTLSNPLSLGCEGSAVFNNKLRLVGIIICTSFKYQNENVNITIAASISEVFRDFMAQLGIKVTSINVAREPSSFAWERALVAIESAGSQGTGTFVTVQHKKFILTCTHVVFKVNSKVICRSIDGEFESDVLWSNPQYDKAYDVALLTAPNNIPERNCARLSTLKPTLGQTVYNAGFPYFVNFNLKYDFNPSIFQGRIIKYTQGAIMSDGCVQAGQSGGPMFDQNGCILGICVSNVKADNVVYPNINTAVPISHIRLTLERYAKTNDIDILNNLVANEEVQSIWSLETPTILSKL